MHEYFQIQIRRRLGHRLNLPQAQLPRQYHALKSEPLQKLRPLGVMHRHLRACMQFHAWKHFLRQIKYPQILHNQRVNPRPPQHRKNLRQLASLRLGQNRIQRHKYLAPQRMRISRKFVKFLRRKILCSRPRRKLCQTEINRVGAVMQRRISCFKAARRRQKFMFHDSFLVSAVLRHMPPKRFRRALPFANDLTPPARFCQQKTSPSRCRNFTTPQSERRRTLP